MRVLIADKLPSSGVRAIAQLGLTVDDRPELGAQDLPEALAQTGAEVLHDAVAGVGLLGLPLLRA